MIKQISFLTVVACALLLSIESESYAHGFGGYHGARGVARNVNVARGINVGVRASGYRSYGYRGPGYAAVGSRGPLVPGYAYGPVVTGPAPGPGPRNLDKIGVGAKESPDLRTGSKEKLNQALNQMSLPSDAGLPAAKKKDK